MDSKPINLLTLPFFARQAVLQNTGFIELLNISRCSKRSEHIVKHETKVRGHKLDVYFNTKTVSFTYFSSGSTPSGGFVVTSVRAIAPNRHIFLKDDTVLFTVDNLLERGKVLYNELQNLFPVPVNVLTVQVDNIFEENYQSFVQWFKKMNPGKVGFEGKDLPYDTFMWVINNIKPKLMLNIENKPANYNGTGALKIETEYLSIRHSEWITVNHLQSIKADRIELKNSSLTDEDINAFLKYLKDESVVYPAPRTYTIGVNREMNINLIMNGLEHIQNDVTYIMFNSDNSFLITPELNVAGRNRIRITIFKRSK